MSSISSGNPVEVNIQTTMATLETSRKLTRLNENKGTNYTHTTHPKNTIQATCSLYYITGKWLITEEKLYLKRCYPSSPHFSVC